MRKFFLFICIFILTTKIAFSEIVILSDGTKIDLKSDGTFVIVEDKEINQISNSQKSILNMLDLSNIEYENIFTNKKDNIILRNITWEDKNLFQTMDELKIEGLNKEYFDNLNIQSFSNYKGRLFDNISIKNWQINTKLDKFVIEYFEIENFDHKLIDKIDYQSALSFFKFIDGLVIDKVILKNALLAEKENNPDFLKLSFEILNLNNLEIELLKISDFNFIFDEYDMYSELLFIEGFNLNSKVFKELNFEKINPDNFLKLLEPINKFEMINSNISNNDYDFIVSASEIITENKNFEDIDDMVIPTKTKFEIKNLRIDTISNNNSELNIFLNDIGKEKFIIDILSNFDWDIDNEKIDTEISLNFGQSFNINLDFILSNFTDEIYQFETYNDSQIEEYLINLKLNEILLYFENNGLIDSIYQFAADSQNITLSDVKKNITNDFLSNSILVNLINEDILTEINDFILNPSNLKIIIDPKPDLTFLQMVGLSNNPKILLDLLNINLKSNY